MSVSNTPSWKIIRQGGGSGLVAYVAELTCDKISDVATLPVSPDFAAGSTCKVIEDSSIYQLGIDNVWHKVSYGGGGGSIDTEWGFF